MPDNQSFSDVFRGYRNGSFLMFFLGGSVESDQCHEMGYLPKHNTLSNNTFTTVCCKTKQCKQLLDLALLLHGDWVRRDLC